MHLLILSCWHVNPGHNSCHKLKPAISCVNHGGGGFFVLFVCGGGSGIFLACKGLGRMFEDSFPTYAFFFFFLVEISSHTLIPLCGKDQSTVA